MTNRLTHPATLLNALIPNQGGDIMQVTPESDIADMALVHAVPERVTELRRQGMEVDFVHVGQAESWFWYVKYSGERIMYVPRASKLG